MECRTFLWCENLFSKKYNTETIPIFMKYRLDHVMVLLYWISLHVEFSVSFNLINDSHDSLILSTSFSETFQSQYWKDRGISFKSEKSKSVGYYTQLYHWTITSFTHSQFDNSLYTEKAFWK